jgi:hypothetical protein
VHIQVDISARVHLLSCLKFRYYSAGDRQIMSRNHRFFSFKKQKKEDDENDNNDKGKKKKKKLNIG